MKSADCNANSVRPSGQRPSWPYRSASSLKSHAAIVDGKRRQRHVVNLAVARVHVPDPAGPQHPHVSVAGNRVQQSGVRKEDIHLRRPHLLKTLPAAAPQPG